MPITVREALASSAAALQTIPEQRPSAARDAALLLRHVTGLTQPELLAHPERTLTAAQQQALEHAVGRRARSEPIQYITGQQEFFGLALSVTPAVLIPRPETELLVEAVAAHLRGRPTPHSPLHILDVGTGSGAIALALAYTVPNAHLTALDLSMEALDVARQNAAALGLTSRLTFLVSDLLSAIRPEVQFDAIVSNPPYIPEPDRPTLAPEVRDHEPALALFAGRQGLDIYRRLIPQAHDLLAPGGLLALEFGFGQQPAIAALLAGWQNLRFLPDLQGIPRVVLASRPA